MSSEPTNVTRLADQPARRRVGWASAPHPRTGRPAQETRQELLRDVHRLRLRVEQHEDALSRLTQALLTLRSGGQALREENRELRRELETERRLRMRDEARRVANGAV
jgi:hypothetical protein